MGKKPNYKILYLFLFLLVCTSVSRGQNQNSIDSLKQLNSTETDQKKIVDNLINIADLLSQESFDSTFHYIDIALQLSEKIKYKNGMAKAFFLQSYYYDIKGDYIKAINSLEKSIDLFIELRDSSYLSGCYNNLGVLYSYGTDQKRSLEYFIKSVQIGEELKDSFALAEGYSNIAGYYDELKEYTSALKYFRKALDVDMHSNDNEKIAISLLDVGYINIKLHLFDDALENLNEAKRLMPDVIDNYNQAILYHRFANYYVQTSSLDSAEAFLQMAIEVTDNIDYPRLYAEHITLKGELLLKQKKYNECLKYLDEAIVLFKKLDAHDALHEIYINKSDAYAGLGRHNEAYAMLQQAKVINETIKPHEIAEYLGEFEKEQTAKEERERMMLEQELNIHRNKNTLMKVRTRLYLAIFWAVLLGAMLAVILYFYFIKRRYSRILESNYETINHQKILLENNFEELKISEQKQIELNATKDKFFSIIAHDLKNLFYTLIGISDVMISNPDIKETDDFEELIEGIFQTAKSGHILLENLLEWARSQTGNIQHKPKPLNLNKLFKSNKTFFSETAKAKDLTITFPDKSDHKVYADVNMVNFIIRNLLNNAIKFSYPGNKIEILAQQEQQYCIITVKDYGVGINPETVDKLFKIEYSVQKDGTENEKGTGLGLILCKEFVEKNGGEIWVESTEGEGSSFHFSLPVFTNKK
ncbi:MAG: ATP-binding protein [Bacteroidota bacterium]